MRVSPWRAVRTLLARTGPGTPKDLSDAIRTFANGLQDIAMNALAGVGNEDPAQSARLRDAEAANNRIAELCQESRLDELGYFEFAGR